MSNIPTHVESIPAPVDPERVAVPLAPTRDEPAVGRPAPDPTRYGDWEKNGRCIDF